METGPHYNYYKNRELSIISAPFSGGQGKFGVEKGPRYMLKHGLQSSLEELGWSTELEAALDEAEFVTKLKKEKESSTGGSSVLDGGVKAKRADVVGEATEMVYKSVSKVVQAGRFPVTLGGDHSVAMGTVSAVLDKFPEAGVLWIDAHADINTIETTDSGNLHGCPVSFLMGLNQDIPGCPESLKWVPGNLSPKKIAFIGLRDIDAGEKKILKDLGISAFSMYHVDKYGINAVVEMAMKAIHPETNGEGPIMCSYDVDGVDPLYIPATGTPVRGGLTLREGLFVVERLAETGNLVALDVVECNPDLAIHDIHVSNTISAGCAIARCALGETLL
ncbi:arginase [Saccharomyces eubayanus]|uniref:arginase n=1 Tax=Saccharomyces eubayanus TaxID=1080349 RepID=UPI0006C2DA44|nr:CAR1-like protein [Saccharomyces eubayanus]KOG96204.1 CAR1-like protein [Saccharomyces eubayanus]